MDFGKLIKETRESKKMSLRELAEKSGVKGTTISNWEHGFIPTIDKLDKVLTALQITITIGKKE